MDGCWSGPCRLQPAVLWRSPLSLWRSPLSCGAYPQQGYTTFSPQQSHTFWLPMTQHPAAAAQSQDSQPGARQGKKASSSTRRDPNKPLRPVPLVWFDSGRRLSPILRFSRAPDINGDDRFCASPLPAVYQQKDKTHQQPPCLCSGMVNSAPLHAPMLAPFASCLQALEFRPPSRIFLLSYCLHPTFALPAAVKHHR